MISINGIMLLINATTRTRTGAGATQGATRARAPPRGAVRITAWNEKPRPVQRRELYDGLVSLVANVNSDFYTGYAGPWQTWRLGIHGGCDGDGVREVDRAFNFRLFKIRGGGPGEGMEQMDLVMVPECALSSDPDDSSPAEAPRFTPYVCAAAALDAPSLPPGYGSHVLHHGPGSEALNPNVSSWLDRSAFVPPHKSQRMLPIPGRALAVVNGALPPSFRAASGELLSGEPWLVEAALTDRKRVWGAVSTYEDGKLMINRSMIDDHIQLPKDLGSCSVDPSELEACMAPMRRPSQLPHGTIDAYARAPKNLHGSYVKFSLDADMRLMVEEGTGCQWGDAKGGPGAVVHMFRDWSYCRQPVNLQLLASAGEPTVTFETGVVDRDGAICRWLITYNLLGDRLLESAVYEHYDGVTEGRTAAKPWWGTPSPFGHR